MKLEITTCRECSVQYTAADTGFGTEEVCGHPEAAMVDFGNVFDYLDTPPPDWCPLRKEALTIELKP